MSPPIDTLARPGSDWRQFDPPLPPGEIAKAVERIGRTLPPGLLELYHACNGGEGSLPFQPWRFVLFGIDFVAELREDQYYRENYDRFVFFGTDGGGEYFGVDPSGRVFYMDAVAGEESIAVVADSFDEFARQIGIPPPPALNPAGQ